MMDYKKAAHDFIQNETEFHLGKIPTEQANPLTRNLSSVIAADTQKGIQMILSADGRIPDVGLNCFKSGEFALLVSEIRRCVEENRMFVFSSVGASGRMGLQLESTWHQFWEELANKLPQHGEEFRRISKCCNSFMTGGDRAVVHTVETFEDYQTFGAQQTIESGAEPGDVVIVLAECGLSSSTIGSAIQAVTSGIRTFYLFCNPKDALCEQLERARKVFFYEDIVFLPLYVGNMAIAGSTRMQVTTVELLVAGAALELAAWDWLKAHLPEKELSAVGACALQAEQYAQSYRSLLAQLSEGTALAGLAEMVDYEKQTYEQHGLITYCTHTYLQDILTDTTERQPTFTLPPFRRSNDHESPLSWAYAKDPLYPSSEAWKYIIRRPVKGLNWTKEDYIRLHAAQSIIDNPPKVGSEQLAYYRIGNEDDPTRYAQHPARLVCVDVNNTATDGSFAWYAENVERFDGGRILRIGDIDGAYDDQICVPFQTAHTIMELLPHLAVKVIFNVISTATMAKMGRVWSNWMIQVLPTNKKLIDRSVRIIAELADIPYETACEEFFKSYLNRPKGQEYRESYVVETLKRLGVDNVASGEI